MICKAKGCPDAHLGEAFRMTTVMPASGLEQMLTNLADRLSRQEENTRRLEKSLFAMVRLPHEEDEADCSDDDMVLNHLIQTPRSKITPPDIRWPKCRLPSSVPAPALSADDTKLDLASIPSERKTESDM